MGNDIFKSGDLYRARQALDSAVLHPYATEISLIDGGASMAITVADPDEPHLNVIATRLDYVPEALWPIGVIVVQPSPDQLAKIARDFSYVCASYAVQKQTDAKADATRKAELDLQRANISADESGHIETLLAAEALPTAQ